MAVDTPVTLLQTIMCPGEGNITSVKRLARMLCNPGLWVGRLPGTTVPYHKSKVANSLLVNEGNH